MKIEAPKNHSADRKESKNVYKTDATVFDRTSESKTAPPALPSPAGGAFAKILEESRRDKNDSAPAKSDANEPETKTASNERDEKTARAADEKKEVEERDARSGDGETSDNSGENHPPVFSPAIAANSLKAPEMAVPAARAILHVADLERIVAMIRSETLQNQRTVLIVLKNSVLQGLQIKLTLDRSGQVRAEFLASGEQVKKQLTARKKELAEILKNRSAQLAEIEIKPLDAADRDTRENPPRA